MFGRDTSCGSTVKINSQGSKGPRSKHLALLQAVKLMWVCWFGVVWFFWSGGGVWVWGRGGVGFFLNLVCFGFLRKESWISTVSFKKTFVVSNFLKISVSPLKTISKNYTETIFKKQLWFSTFSPKS